MFLPLLERWARSSQQVARRNAMVATTEASRRRVERDEVATYLSGRAPTAAGPPSEAVAAAR